jgi:hypothetical protein
VEEEVELDELLAFWAMSPTPSPPTAPASIPNKIRTTVLSTNVSLPVIHIFYSPANTKHDSIVEPCFVKTHESATEIRACDSL